VPQDHTADSCGGDGAADDHFMRSQLRQGYQDTLEYDLLQSLEDSAAVHQVPPDRNDVFEILQCIGTIHQGFHINDFCRSTLTQFSIGPLKFMQVDYGISFLPFLEDLDDRLLKSPAALEPFRCFFLHLGAGTGIHPFALQEVFRHHCERLRCLFQVMHKDLPASEDRNLPIKWDEPINDLLQKGHYINFEVLRACWPLEFDSYRILTIVDRAGADPYFLLLDPSNDKSSNSAEVVLRFDGIHFTLLIGQSISDIEKSQNQKDSAKFLVVPRSEFLHTGSWQPGRARCSLQALEQATSHLSPACSSPSHSTKRWEKDIVLKDKDQAFEAVLTCATADKRTAALAVVKHNADVERLVDMGFQRNCCQQALHASGGDIEQAVHALLTPPAGSSIPTDSNQLVHLLSMGYPRELCVQALKVNMNRLESAVNWINDMQPSNPGEEGVCTDDVQRLCRMGFSANGITRMARRLQQQLQNQHVAEARLELVLYNLLEPYRIQHLVEMEENPPIRQLTQGGGNCCFHALLCALGHLQQSTGYNFRESALPLDHAGMRKAIVDFESRNLNANDLFLFGLVWLNPLSQFIGPDPQTHLEV
jgi:hypothetical protein